MNSTVSQPQEPLLASFAQFAREVEAYMAEFLEARSFPENLRDAIRYALLGKGKRLRPSLVLLSCEAVGGQALEALPAAAAIEMIHCFSLVHDDLPAMDDDDLRRGKLSLHRHTSEAMAILAGDAMVSLAFEVVASRLRCQDLVGRISLELASATNEMIAGQVYDTLGGLDPKADPATQLKTIHCHKTAALIRCSSRMGALCGGANESQIEAITDYADAIGLMFQIIDDLLDVTQTTEHLGKAANKDLDKGKLTYPGLLGFEKSCQEVERLRSEAHRALEPLGEQADRLGQLCDRLAIRQK